MDVGAVDEGDGMGWLLVGVSWVASSQAVGLAVDSCVEQGDKVGDSESRWEAWLYGVPTPDAVVWAGDRAGAIAGDRWLDRWLFPTSAHLLATGLEILPSVLRPWRIHRIPMDGIFVNWILINRILMHRIIMGGMLMGGMLMGEIMAGGLLTAGTGLGVLGLTSQPSVAVVPPDGVIDGLGTARSPESFAIQLDPPWQQDADSGSQSALDRPSGSNLSSQRPRAPAPPPPASPPASPPAPPNQVPPNAAANAPTPNRVPTPNRASAPTAPPQARSPLPPLSVATPFFYDRSPPGSYDFTFHRHGKTAVDVPSPCNGKVLRTWFQGRTGNLQTGRGAGNIVVVQCSTDRWLFGHFAQVKVRSGQGVKRGQSLGIQGCTGRCSGPHVHLQLHRSSDGQRIADRRITERPVRDYLAFAQRLRPPSPGAIAAPPTPTPAPTSNAPTPNATNPSPPPPSPFLSVGSSPLGAESPRPAPSDPSLMIFPAAIQPPPAAESAVGSSVDLMNLVVDSRSDRPAEPTPTRSLPPPLRPSAPPAADPPAAPAAIAPAEDALAITLDPEPPPRPASPVARPASPTVRSQPAPVQPVPQRSQPAAAAFFAHRQSLGARAIGHAEGNYTAEGKTTRNYRGHSDPGNDVQNIGFCSLQRYHWRDFDGNGQVSLAEADRRCLDLLRPQANETADRLATHGYTARLHVQALINCVDLYNQSRVAGRNCPRRYRQARDRGLTGEAAYVWARVESFRTSSGRLSASGLFRICRNSPQRRHLSPWDCIASDQRRRVRALARAIVAFTQANPKPQS